VKEGEKVQTKTRKIAEEKVSNHQTGKRHLDKLEKVFEDRVARALHSLACRRGRMCRTCRSAWPS